MEFEGQYLTYDEYKSLGGSLDQTPFNLLEFEARRQIDSRTQNRLRKIDEDDIPQEVKICMFNLMDVLKSYSSNINKNVQSEHVGEYSVTYGGNISEFVRGKQSEIDDIISNDLYGIIVNNEHLIYIGVKE